VPFSLTDETQESTNSLCLRSLWQC